MSAGDHAPETGLPAAFDAAENEISLRILALTDLHMEIRPYDYFADRPQSAGGLARAAGLVERLRAEARNSLLFDNGDILQGNPMGDYFAGRQGGETVAHPMIAALNTLGLDAATLGNHEFNYGLSFLRAALQDANYPVLSANAITTHGAIPADDETLIPPYTILERGMTDGAGKSCTVRIGVIGLLPPQIVYWDRKHLTGQLVTRGIVETTRAYVPRMKDEGADLIVALSHSGIAPGNDSPGLENASLQLAEVDGLDVIIAGHTHQVFPSPGFAGGPGIDAREGRLHGKPAVMAGFGGSHVGIVDLLLARRGPAWSITASRTCAARVPQEGTAPGAAERAVLDATETAHRETLAHIRCPVAKSARPLHSYFALLRPCDPIRLVAAAQASALRARLAGTVHADLPLLSAAAPFKAGGRGGADKYTDVPAGDVALRHVADIYSFPNTLVALLIDGAGLRAWLEHAAGVFRRLRPHQADQTLRNDDFPSYNFDTIFGVTYRIDLSEPARFDPNGTLLNSGAARIRDLAYQGSPVTDDQMFVVATNDYRASGSGTYPGADQGEPIPVGAALHRDLLVRYLQGTAPDRPLPPIPWDFVPITGASALVETGLGAAAYEDQAEELGLTRLDDGRGGHLIYRRAF